MEDTFDSRMARRLKALRVEHGWSLDDLAERCGVSRSTLSRMENAEVSPTAAVLGRLGACYGLTTSRLMAMAEVNYAPLMRRAKQKCWIDPDTGYRRRSVSPPAEMLAAEVIEGEMPPGQEIEYSHPPRLGMEHHIVVLDGELQLTVDRTTYALQKGDCLRYRLYGANSLANQKDVPARYLLVIV